MNEYAYFTSAFISTLERINWLYGNGTIRSFNHARSIVTVQRTSCDPVEYKYTLLPNNRVRFRGMVRKIGFTIR